MNKQLRSLSISVSALLAFALFNTPLSSAAEPLIGTWEGAVFINGTPIGVDLEINLVKTNTKGGAFHYGEPRACRVNIVYITVDEGVYWFAMTESSGGYCDKLDGKHLKLTPASDRASLNYAIDATQSGAKKESAMLHRSTEQQRTAN